MRRAISLLLLICAAAAAQTDRPMVMTAGFANGVTVVFTTVTEPGGAPPRWANLNGGLVVKDGVVAHRYFRDHKDTVFFGYDLTVELIPGTARFRVSILPLSIGWEQVRSGAAGRRVPAARLPSYPPPQVVNSGDTIELDVFVSPSTGQRIVDRMQISTDPLFAPPDLAGARDFQLSDVQLTLMNPVLSVNGTAAAASPNGGVSGAIVWIYAPGHGRFMFSIQPHEGYPFRLAGSILSGTLSFRAGADAYELKCSAPILTRSGRWNLYVLEDSGAIPPGPAKVQPGGLMNLYFGAKDRLEHPQTRK
jgi:hypothetical protein